MNTSLKRIGILTGGGDCPGLNAVIRSIAKPAMTFFNATVIGILDGFEGFVEGRMRELSHLDVSGIINLGGTILGTSNKGDPFHYPRESATGVTTADCSHIVLENYRRWELDVLIAIGGDGTMNIAYKLAQMGMNIIGVPKTIDNDLEATDITFGHDSALAVATEAIDRLQTTASAHHRVIVVEVMGRYAGWIALGAGVAGGADVILIPEIPFKWKTVFDFVRKRSKGARFSIICCAEGAKPEGGELVVKERDAKRTDPIRLGGIADLVARRIQEETKIETRVTVLGHLQRGGSPTAFDRILGTKFGALALQAASRREFGCMVSLRGRDVVTVKLEDAIRRQRLVPPDSQLLFAARAVGISFGD
ncbi:MAG: ATP-dependent 6-phosphofructokinase [Ignavibacteria bacterium]|nr:ATP-dependent 6-phosphofructokinase [Ignavibacteria bacterium]MBI3765856.1 ATP-dependent 6-phosphofructokinase [Ignavibacteriales bacterium]